MPGPNYFVLFVEKKHYILQNVFSSNFRGARGVGVGKNLCIPPAVFAFYGSIICTFHCCKVAGNRLMTWRWSLPLSRPRILPVCFLASNSPATSAWPKSRSAGTHSSTTPLSPSWLSKLSGRCLPFERHLRRLNDLHSRIKFSFPF